MATKTRTRTLFVMAALASALGALWACKNVPADGQNTEVSISADPEAHSGTRGPGPDPRNRRSLPTPAAEGVDLAAGQPWTEAQRYIDSLSFPAEPAFPTADVQQVHLCEGCDAVLRLVPELGMLNLKKAHIRPGEQRIVARLDWVPGDVSITEIGAVQGNTAGSAYLLTDSEGVGRLIYDEGGLIAEAPLRFAFKVNQDGHSIGTPMARWKRPDPLEHHTVDHLTGVWVACSEGCCTAQAEALAVQG